MVIEVRPGALTVNVACPVLEASAEIVTFCAVAKLAGVKVRDPPPLTDRPVLPEVREVVTVTLADGADDRLIPTVPLWPCWTFSDVALATRLGVFPPTCPVHVVPFMVNVVGLVLVPL